MNKYKLFSFALHISILIAVSLHAEVVSTATSEFPTTRHNTLVIDQETLPAVDAPAHIGIIKLIGDIDTNLVELFIKRIYELAYRPDIDGALLLIGSGGGDAGIGELLFREVKMLASKKPVVALAPVCFSMIRAAPI